MDDNEAVRAAAIRHCRLLALTWGDAIPASELTAGFPHGYGRLKLITWGRGISTRVSGVPPASGRISRRFSAIRRPPRSQLALPAVRSSDAASPRITFGLRPDSVGTPDTRVKPQQLTDGPLTLVSSLASSYDDEHLDDDTLLYDYAPSPSNDWANEGLKRVAALGRSVVLLRQVKPKPQPEYMVLAPVAVTSFDDVARRFRLSLAPATSLTADIPSPAPTVFSKAYAETIVRARLHQAHFRRETLSAYRRRCCICELDEGVLKGAAHIVPYRLPEGLATVNNGLCMCPTHHRAFDTSLLVVKPTYEIAIARERLQQAVPNEATARQLLAFEGRVIGLPGDVRLRPDAELLRQKIELVA